MAHEQNKALARRFLGALWSEGRLAVADEILAPDFVMTLSVKPFRLEGPESLKGLVARNRAAFQGLTYDLEEEGIVAEYDRVVVPWRMRARHVGQWGDSAPSNADVAIEGVSLFRARDGRLIECRVQNEALSLLRQVGTLPPPGAPEHKRVEANKATVRRYVEELLIKGNFGRASELVTDSFAIDRSAIPEAIAGPDGLQKQMDLLRRGFPDLELRIADLFGEGDKVAVRFEAPGTHRGEFAGIAPTNRPVTWRGIVIYQLEGGKVAHAWADWDDVGLLQAIQA